jgi:hypothetical protein
MNNVGCKRDGIKWSIKIMATIFFLCLYGKGTTQVWQWSVSVDSVISGETNAHPQAFLWIPEHCKQVRAVVVGQHNMIEEGIFEHVAFRKAMSELGFAVVWVSPNWSVTFDFNKDADEDFNYMMKKLADSSGYKELEVAPIVPIGHSALASYPWNFAAWNPGRTLAAISIHGDAPLTKLTGSGKANPDWGSRAIEGVPGLFIMGEYEWWEDRIVPGFNYVSNHPKTPITFFADAGHGHFDYSDELIEYVCLFIRKAAAYRLPSKLNSNNRVTLNSINPASGWLIDKWRKDSLPTAKAAPYKEYKGDRKVASWVFDKDLAVATEKFYVKSRGKKEQHIGIIQNGEIVKPTGGHAQFTIPFIPINDGIRFTLKAFFADTSKAKPVIKHATTPITINRICGPVIKVNDTTFQIHFYRMGLNNPKRSNDIWLLAKNDGDAVYKSAVQQLDIRFPLVNFQGKPQQISFGAIPNQKAGTSALKLNATSTTNVPVYYYVKEGPAEVKGDKLVFTRIPPKAKFPLRVTVVAWQYGTAVEPKLQSAVPVERTFWIISKI